MDTETPRLATDTETLKLIKNTKGYNWEIKLIGIDLARLAKINDEMLKQYGETNTLQLP